MGVPQALEQLQGLLGIMAIQHPGSDGQDDAVGDRPDDRRIANSQERRGVDEDDVVGLPGLV